MRQLFFKYLSSTLMNGPCICIWAFKWDPYLPYPRGPDTEGREGKGPTCEYLQVPFKYLNEWPLYLGIKSRYSQVGPFPSLPFGRGPT